MNLGVSSELLGSDGKISIPDYSDVVLELKEDDLSSI